MCYNAIMNDRITLRLTVEKPRKLSGEFRQRWPGITGDAMEYDAPYIIFLGELLGLLDNDRSPRFAASTYSSVDMFGGCDQRWTLTTRHASLRREFSQEINESWQHVDVEVDTVEITGLPPGVFLEWDGDLGCQMDVGVGNVPVNLEPPILAIARALFTVVTVAREEASAYSKVRADLKSEAGRGTGRFAGRPGDPGAADVVKHTISALMDPDSDVATAALERLEDLNLLDRAAEASALHDALANSPSNVTRAAIAEALGRRGQSQHMDALALAAESDDSTLRSKALLALAKLGDPAALPHLLRGASDSWFQVRWDAASALCKVSTPESWPQIKPAMLRLLKDENHYVREVAVEALTDNLEPDLFGPLVAGLKDDSDWVRQKAAWALGKLGDRRAVARLTPLLDDDEESVRVTSADALGALGDPRAAPALRERLCWEAADSRTRKSIDEALGRLSGQGV
jgi:HEAT repeat protein